MATALAVISLIGIGVSAVQQRKISKEQKKQNRIANKVAAITRQRNVKRQIAASRIQVAQQQAAGFELGVSGSTAVIGATAGVISDTASTIGQSNLQATGQQFIAESQNRVSSLQQTQSLFNTVSAVTGGLASNPQALSAITSLV